MSAATHRVLVVDDHPVFRAGLCAILETAADLTVVAEATTGLEAVERARETSPDLVLMDLHMPVLGGVEATRRILERAPSTRILVLTMIDQEEAVAAALRAGARGYLLKGSDRAEVLRAVRAVASGDAVFSSRVADRLPALLSAQSSRTAAFPDLTEREDQILALMARGRDNGEIADELSLSLKTVRNYVSSIFSKLEVSGRSQAIVKAREAGIGVVGERS
jgi:DNA-binding NarL/FixJ family response regulator